MNWGYTLRSSPICLTAPRIRNQAFSVVSRACYHTTMCVCVKWATPPHISASLIPHHTYLELLLYQIFSYVYKYPKHVFLVSVITIHSQIYFKHLQILWDLQYNSLTSVLGLQCQWLAGRVPGNQEGWACWSRPLLGRAWGWWHWSRLPVLPRGLLFPGTSSPSCTNSLGTPKWCRKV